MSVDLKQYDGFIFTPGEEENSQVIRFIKLHKDCGKIIESTDLGEKYHVVFFKHDEEGNFSIDENFEATFSDPLTYVKNLINMPLGGTFIRKRERSKEWFDDYLTGMIDSDIIQKS